MQSKHLKDLLKRIKKKLFNSPVRSEKGNFGMWPMKNEVKIKTELRKSVKSYDRVGGAGRLLVSL